VRFLGGAVAPPLATTLAAAFTAATPYYVGAASVALSAALIIAGRRALGRVDAARPEPVADEAHAITLGDAA
jgi:membrane protein implicated in regulation of membrane protease activity